MSKNLRAISAIVNNYFGLFTTDSFTNFTGCKNQGPSLAHQGDIMGIWFHGMEQVGQFQQSKRHCRLWGIGKGDVG